MSTAISSNKFDILRSDDENERNYEEQAGGGGGGVVAKYVSLEKEFEWNIVTKVRDHLILKNFCLYVLLELSLIREILMIFVWLNLQFSAVNHHPRSGSGGPVVASFDPNQNPLEHRYTFWLSKRKSVLKGKNYDQSMMKLGSFDTVQQFWRYYSFMKRPSKVDEACDLMLVSVEF